MIKLAFGAGSVPCKQQHTMSMEIELARPTLRLGRVRCPVFFLLALAIFADEKSNRGLRGLNGSEGICVLSALSAVQPSNFLKCPSTKA
jgi:hypothetical protein